MDVTRSGLQKPMLAAIRRAVPGGVWSIVAPVRSSRPQPGDSAPAGPHCHFCPGSEGETEPEVFAVRPPGSVPDTPGWQVRVVPNKYPALQPALAAPAGNVQPYREIAARGLHEVIVETPRHDYRFVDFSDDEMTTVLAVYQDRVRAASRQAFVKSVALFRNEGPPAGASQLHAHAQLVALPIVPGRLAGEVAGASQYFRRRWRCVTCDALAREGSDGDRLVEENAGFVAVASFAPRFPYETWIVPKQHQHDFASASPEQVQALAAILTRVLGAMKALLDPFPFNLVLQSPPVRSSQTVRQAFHWRLEIVPRLTTASGFELGSGVFIVSVPPEEAARRLRGALGTTPRDSADAATPAV